MAQVPRGEPRSVEDPDREPYEEMIRTEKLQRTIAEGDYDSEPDYFTLYPRSQGVPLPASAPNTPQNALFCTVPDAISPAERASRRQAIERALTMADSPLGGAAYGIASLAGASQRGRDQALAAGVGADTVMTSVAPFGAALRGRPTPPAPAAGPIGSQRPSIRYGELNERGQATGAKATLTEPMLDTGTRANWRQTPPGWQGDGSRYNEARAHLLGRQLGGRGVPRNIATMTQNGANTPQMRGFEDAVARRVRAGEVVEYFATPLYEDGILPPSAVLVSATGSRQQPMARLIFNLAGARR